MLAIISSSLTSAAKQRCRKQLGLVSTCPHQKLETCTWHCGNHGVWTGGADGKQTQGWFKTSGPEDLFGSFDPSPVLLPGGFFAEARLCFPHGIGNTACSPQEETPVGVPPKIAAVGSR